MTDWQYATPFNLGQPGTPVAGGGGRGLVIQYRDNLDAARARTGVRVPSAEYPDGYLGTIQSRREDRLLDALKNRLNQRSYQRGVHKGERADPADYIWPPELDPYMAGIARQATTGQRAAPLMTTAEQLLLPRGSGSLLLQPPNPQNLDDLRRLAPGWK